MFALITSLAGGIGLLLMGMSLMTDGLRLASGNALRDVLALWTNSRLRGLISGFFITGLVQSSSAVTVATIGFANAGMLSLDRAVWVIYGSNVGTTMTAWIVAFIGFQLNIESLALPVVAAGMLLKLTGGQSSRSNMGIALAGFGLLFLGIGVLKTAFDGLGDQISIPELNDFGLVNISLLVLTGFALTTLMQSSSAALVIALGAAESGLIPLNAAAAIVIGANLGTTTTAAFSAIGATATARRVAISHILFNLVTAMAAMLLLNPMLWTVATVESMFNLLSSPATTLAIFHTVFNLLGVLLMWPLSRFLVSWLESLFTTSEEKASQPKYLDKTVLTLPFIALDAMALEVSRINQYTISAIKQSLQFETIPETPKPEAIRQLANATVRYAVDLNGNALSPFLAQVLNSLLECIQSHMLVLTINDELGRLRPSLRIPLDHDVENALHIYLENVKQHLEIQDISKPYFAESEEPSYQKVEKFYRSLKNIILIEASTGKLEMQQVDTLLVYSNQLKRLCRHLYKGSSRLIGVRETLQRNPKDQVTQSVSDDQVNREKLLELDQQIALTDARTHSEL